MKQNFIPNGFFLAKKKKIFNLFKQNKLSLQCTQKRIYPYEKANKNFRNVNNIKFRTKLNNLKLSVNLKEMKISLPDEGLTVLNNKPKYKKQRWSGSMQFRNYSRKNSIPQFNNKMNSILGNHKKKVDSNYYGLKLLIRRASLYTPDTKYKYNKMFKTIHNPKSNEIQDLNPFRRSYLINSKNNEKLNRTINQRPETCFDSGIQNNPKYSIAIIIPNPKMESTYLSENLR